jgi:hypothetical protein
MPLETGTYISDLNASNPAGTDTVDKADDHLRFIKSTLLASFPGVTGAVTATHTELNILDGATLSTAELNILDGVTATAAELNILDGVTATTAELNYVEGVTSSIQTQLDAKLSSDAELTAIAGLTSAADKLPYFTGSGTASLADLTSAARNLLDDADVSAMRTTLEVPFGQETIWVPAGAMTSRTTNGAASGSMESTTNDVMTKYLAFDTATSEAAQFMVQMPKSWDEGTIVAQFVWTHPATTTNFGVKWGIRAVAFANDDALDTAFGTEQEIADTGGTTSDVYITSETAAMTVAGSPAAEELVCFEVYRDPADGSDTMAVDAYLIGVKLHYTVNASSDS